MAVIEQLGKGLQGPDDTLFSVRGNGRKWQSGVATRTAASPARLAFVGDSITEGLDGSYVTAFRKRVAPLNGFKNGPGWVHGSQDVANVFNPYKFIQTAGTTGTEDVHAISTSGWSLPSGGVLTLETWTGPAVTDYAATTVMCDRIEFHYTVRGDSGTAGSLTFATELGTLGTVNTVDTSIGAGNYEIRTVVYTVTRGLHSITVTGSGGQPSIFGGAYIADGDTLWVYPIGDSGDEFTDMNMSTSGRTIQGLKAIDADLVWWMHGTNTFHAGDQAAAVTAASDLELAITNTRTALPDVSLAYSPPYPAQSRTTWPLFVIEWKRVCAKNDVPVCDLSTMLLTNAATTDPFDLIHDGGSIANTHPNQSGADYMADQLARFIGMPPIDWITGTTSIVGNDQNSAMFTGFGFAAGLVITKHDTGKAYLQLRDDKSSLGASTGLIGEIGMGGRGATTLLGTGGINSLAWIRFQVPSGSWSDTSAPTDILFGNAPSGSITVAERLRILAGGGLLLPAGSLTSYLQNANVLVTIPTDKTASFTFDANHGGASVGVSSASATNATVPPNSSVAFPVGTAIEVRQVGTAQTTLVAGAGVTLTPYPTSALKTAGQGAAISLLKIATDTWSVQGGSV